MLLFFPVPFAWSWLVSSFYWVVLLFFLFLLRGGAFLPLLWVVLLFPLLFCWVVLLGFPFTRGVAVCRLFSPFAGAAFRASPLSSVGWRCLVFLLWVVLLFCSSLLLSGAAWFPPPLGGVVVFPSSFAWCCPFPPLWHFFSSLRLGGAALLLLLWVVLLSKIQKKRHMMFIPK